MTIPLRFAYPDALVPLPLDDPQAGAVAAAQEVLGRFATPVERSDAEGLEHAFVGLAELMVRSEFDKGFLIVPQPPQLGVLGWVTVRWLPAAGIEPVAETVASVVDSVPFLVDDPLIESRSTTLGSATRLIYRYAAEKPAVSRFGRTKKSSLPVTEQIGWYWLIDDSTGPDLVLSITSSTENLEFTPLLRDIVDAVAEGASRDDRVD